MKYVAEVEDRQWFVFVEDPTRDTGESPPLLYLDDVVAALFSQELDRSVVSSPQVLVFCC